MNVSACVVRLLNHYWTDNDDLAVRRAQIEDWVEDLVEFPIDAVEEACREWRRQSENRRPTPGQIRALTIEASIEINRRAALPPPPPAVGSDGFPSLGHREALRTKFKEGKHNWAVLTTGERWHYHAYNYAWRRVYFAQEDRRYELDHDGRWFDAALADAAERMFRKMQPPPLTQHIAPADDPRFSTEMREHFARQDKERAPLRRAVQIHGERDANGGPTPEMEAFIACCTRQVHANRLQFLERSRAASRGDPLERVRDEMGVRATEC